MSSSRVSVVCYFCRRKFLTKKAYFIFNKASGYRSFCSKRCHYKSKYTGKILTCENPKCPNKFYRALGYISSFNYCSSSCAAIINNQKYPKWPEKYCKICKKPFRREGSPYCSLKCGKLGRFKYTKEEIINMLKSHFNKHGRIPAKREVLDISYKATNLFGSWNNAVSAAGLIPNRSRDNRMYMRSKTKALDGHLCDSISEAIIDNWLNKHNIPHIRNKSYPSSKHLTDWAVKHEKIFIEYFGLAKDSPRYDRSIQEKIMICKENNIKLISIYPKDLYPFNNLNKILRKLI